MDSVLAPRLLTGSEEKVEKKLKKEAKGKKKKNRRESWEMRLERYLGVTLKKILNASLSICDFILWVLYQSCALELLDVLVEIW